MEKTLKIDYEKLKNWPIEDVIQKYTSRDSIIYALGVGLGENTLNEDELNFVYEQSTNFCALPTMAAVIGNSTKWIQNPATGVDYVQVLHGEQTINWRKPMPTQGAIKVSTQVTGISDKGAHKGALIFSEKVLASVETGETIATTQATTFARANGGYDGPSDPSPTPHRVPNTKPDLHCDLITNRRAAMIYRLSGDYNPLHISPDIAKQAGFNKPILHGLCTFGVAGHAILKSCCSYKPERLKSLSLRFSAPVFPGETIRTEIWINGDELSFRSIALERNTVVLNNGYAKVN